MMTLSQNTTSHERLRLPPRNSMILKGGFPLWFPAIFIIIGLVAIAVTLNKPPHNDRMFALLFGVTFTAFGLLFMLAPLFAVKPTRNPARAEQRDYPWEPSGFTHTPYRPAILSVGCCVVVASLILCLDAGYLDSHRDLANALMTLGTKHRTLAEWWSLSGDVGAFLLLFFTVFVLFLFVRTALLLLKAMRFGNTRVLFDQFPYLIGHDFSLRWMVPRNVSQAISGRAVLRCVEEWTEVTEHGNNTNHHLIHEEIWSSAWVMPSGTALRPGDELRLQCALPPDLPPTQMSAAPVIFWELEVKLQLPGPDFEARYLIPIY